jgi:hypothetical protein
MLFMFKLVRTLLMMWSLMEDLESISLLRDW